MAAFVSLLCGYSEAVVAEALNPTTGLPIHYEYLPALSQIKQALDIAAEAHWRVLAREARVRAQIAEEASLGLPNASKRHSDKTPKMKPDYTGPIENVKPGDILSWERMEEYRNFMAEKHGMYNIRHWGRNEKWIDSGLRPFDKLSANSSQSQPANPSSPPEEPNPFEAPQ